MSDETTPAAAPTGDPGTTVQVPQVSQVRIMSIKEHPDQALMEFKTAKGSFHFVMRKSALPELAQKMTSFVEGEKK